MTDNNTCPKTVRIRRRCLCSFDVFLGAMKYVSEQEKKKKKTPRNDDDSDRREDVTYFLSFCPSPASHSI